jgi:hypothetical protein
MDLVGQMVLLATMVMADPGLEGRNLMIGAEMLKIFFRDLKLNFFC